MKSYTVRLNAEQYGWLKRAAAREGVSMSEIARRLIDRAPDPLRPRVKHD